MLDKKPEKPYEPENYLPPADRPLECGECKKTITVHYTEIVGNAITHTIMCADCPELQRRLFGIASAEQVTSQTGIAGLGCGNCGTTLEEVKRGHRLGCSECYDVFGDLLLIEMQSAGKLPPKVLASLKKSHAIHLGRGPGESLAVSPSSRLLALNEALRETLNREDYEQAAWLRDQIKALTEDEGRKEEKEKKDESK